MKPSLNRQQPKPKANNNMPQMNHATDDADMSYGGQSFQPFEFDETVDPDLPDGLTYELQISDVKTRLSNADAAGRQYPQAIIEWKALSTEDESEVAQRAVGNTTSEFITFRPKGDRKGNLSKQRLTRIRNVFGIGSEVVPTSFTETWQDDMQPLCDALKGQTTTRKIKSKLDNRGQWRSEVILEMANGGGDDTEVEVEETPASAVPTRKPAAKATAKATNGHANGNGKAKARR
jgi:hypothetical protein